jgi:acetyl esterase/lipase
MGLLKLLTAFFGLFGPGFSPASLLNLTVPRSGYRRIRDVAYGNGPRQRMDVYVPQNRPASAPVLLFFYGGAFRCGRKEEYPIVGQAFASKGIVVAVADYRIHPEGRFPDFLEDGAQALAAVHARAGEWGGDPNRIFVAGHSAGAYLAVMLAANPSYLRAAKADPSWIRGVIALAGRYHELPLGDVIALEIFRGPARDETRPSTYIDGKRPPMLLASGANDHPSVLESLRRLAARLREHGSEAEEIVYPGIGHMAIMLAFAPGFRGRAPVRDDIVRFIATH